MRRKEAELSSGSSPHLQQGTLAEQELVSSLSWLIDLRWLGGVGVLVGTWFASSVLGLPVPSTPLYILGIGILAYNALFWWVLRQCNTRFLPSTRVYQWCARVQIGIDWLAMALLVHLTGGIDSPVIIFFLLHIIIASLLLPHDRGFLYVTLAPALVAGIALLELFGLVPHVPLFDSSRYKDPLVITSTLVFFSAAAYTTAYLSMTISKRLRRREDQLAALYRSLQATTSTLELTAVLDRLAEATAKALNCKAAAIRLLDRTGSHLEMAGSYGLSKEYKDKAPIEVARAPLDRRVLLGEMVLVSEAMQEDRLRYPEKVAAEGIHTILVAPLIGKTGPIGLLRAYRGTDQGFAEDDKAFLAAIAAEGAVAIENAQAYRMLATLDRQKSDFVRIVTHELRSPVGVAISVLCLLEQGYVGELTPPQADLIARAQRRMQFLQTLIDDLLDLAAGKADVVAAVERGPVSLSGVAEEVYARFEPPAQAKGLSLSLERADGQLHVWGDRSELDRILNNLVGNAVKYTAQGGVRLLLARDDGAARLVVSDTGIGIPQDALPHLFEEFYRAPNARLAERAGTGLGLSIVKNLVDRYGGALDVTSVEGQGTTFTLTLPLIEPPPG